MFSCKSLVIEKNSHATVVEGFNVLTAHWRQFIGASSSRRIFWQSYRLKSAMSFRRQSHRVRESKLVMLCFASCSDGTRAHSSFFWQPWLMKHVPCNLSQLWEWLRSYSHHFRTPFWTFWQRWSQLQLLLPSKKLGADTVRIVICFDYHDRRLARSFTEAVSFTRVTTRTAHHWMLASAIGVKKFQTAFS